ncbi:SpoIIE family protein phosphatase [Streptomyces sp. TRM 70361]|uniref:SpoIIE family protein phosphatase n=1 Tax=Streptomyces sp. TRM 70361 TaxID=3116553 RepID=UPI002E7B6191|nr:SpoIIE family protein phosphatase [Streptomyces sp. TRM 70361]MEE1940804.1 SpoIIE family protein phosphatase [Streptomyces sp. TRM 70361]
MGDARFDLSALSLSEMVRCGAELRKAAREAASMEEAAQTVADFLYRGMTDAGGRRVCPLVRLFVTRRWDALGPEDRAAALVRSARPGTGPPAPDTRCLALVASRGSYPPWQDPDTGAERFALPVSSPEALQQVPLLSRLIERIGTGGGPEQGEGAGGPLPSRDRFEALQITDDARTRELWGREFVAEYGIRSALAFGGPLPDGELFAVLVFSRVPLPPRTAELLRTVAVSTRMALIPGGPQPPGGTGEQPVRERAAATEALLGALEESVQRQAARLETLVAELSATARELRDSQRELQRREEQLREEADIVETLQQVGNALAAELDLDLLVQHASDAATRLTGAAFGAFFYNVTGETGESYRLYVVSGEDRSAFDRFPLPRNTEVFEPTFRGVGVLRSDDITADPRYGRNAPYRGMPEGHLPVRSYLAVPVVSRGEVLGGFFFGHPEPGMFTERHERLATGVAAQTAVALQNARTYRQERAAATELQRHLLPVLPQVEGLVRASRYLPATRGTEAGGDWVDLIPLSGGEVALVVGDVMGKGIRAAAVMGQIRTACRAYATLGLAPAEVLRQLSTLVDDIAPGRITTCAYATLDADRGRLRVAVAGHLPPALRDAYGAVRLLDERIGPPLGVGRHGYTEQEVPFPPGARLLLYTDGLVERRERPIDAGLGELRELLAGATGEIEADCDSWLEALTRGGRHDDIAMLCVHRPAAAEEDGRAVVVREYPPVSDAVPVARQVVSDTMHGWGLGRLATDMMLIADELVANAVRHARTPLRMELRRAEDRIVLEVTDSSSEEPRLVTSAPGEFGHRGIFLVDAIAARWGTRRVAGGKVVWAEVAA